MQTVAQKIITIEKQSKSGFYDINKKFEEKNIKEENLLTKTGLNEYASEMKRVASIKGLEQNRDFDQERYSKIRRNGTPVQDKVVNNLPSPATNGNEKSFSLLCDKHDDGTEDDHCDN